VSRVEGRVSRRKRDECRGAGRAAFAALQRAEGVEEENDYEDE
jgi:hypothetical protein